MTTHKIEDLPKSIGTDIRSQDPHKAWRRLNKVPFLPATQGVNKLIASKFILEHNPDLEVLRQHARDILPQQPFGPTPTYTHQEEKLLFNHWSYRCHHCQCLECP